MEEAEGGGEAREKVRRTSGESSGSTERARRAILARRGVGKGRVIVLISRVSEPEVGAMR